jgi:ubiquinone/menaquinone biosynthesis C-methylase UbiE
MGIDVQEADREEYDVERKFDPDKIERLEDRKRLESLAPELLWEAMGVAGGTVVEIGAGTGLVAAEFLAMEPGIDIVATDVEPVMIDWMMERRPEVAEGRMVPLHTDEVHIPLADESASAVYTVNLHHELDDTLSSYREAYRILRPGAPILVIDWDARETGAGPPVEIRSSAAEIAAVMREAGFVDIASGPELPYHTVTRGIRPKE